LNTWAACQPLAVKSFVASPVISDEEISMFKEHFSRKGGALITVDVEVSDVEDNTTAVGVFNGFIQSISEEI